MLNQKPAGATVTTGQLTDIPALKPATPNRAFGRSGGKAAPQKKPGGRKQGSPSFKRSVLVVDDVPDVTEMIGLYLKHAGYEVTTADSAQAALRLAQEKAFDVIVSDIGMPEMNGYELAECLRRRAEYQGIPIIAVTGYSEYDDSGRARRAGFNAHLTKPIDPSELLQLINELLA
jgi:CheY-like chemotaxis protein